MLSVKAVTYSFISAPGSAILSAKQGKSGSFWICECLFLRSELCQEHFEFDNTVELRDNAYPLAVQVCKMSLYILSTCIACILTDRGSSIIDFIKRVEEKRYISRLAFYFIAVYNELNTLNNTGARMLDYIDYKR